MTPSDLQNVYFLSDELEVVDAGVAEEAAGVVVFALSLEEDEVLSLDDLSEEVEDLLSVELPLFLLP